MGGPLQRTASRGCRGCRVLAAGCRLLFDLLATLFSHLYDSFLGHFCFDENIVSKTIWAEIFQVGQWYAPYVSSSPAESTLTPRDLQPCVFVAFRRPLLHTWGGVEGGCFGFIVDGPASSMCQMTSRPLLPFELCRVIRVVRPCSQLSAVKDKAETKLTNQRWVVDRPPWPPSPPLGGCH